MRAVLGILGVAALLSGSGCFVRPWAIEESERIDRLLECEVDDAEGEAFEGIAAPRWISPSTVVEVERQGSYVGQRPSASKGKKSSSSSSRGSKEMAPFSSLTPSSGKSGSKKR
ncbi:MAG TPA: hypothetical protein VGK67_04085 [Myxococcales bacterium]|jgi:hypothetical protein